MTTSLAGIRILDFSHMIAGPYTTMLLSHFGAEVIKVESARRPDGFRVREGNDLNNSRPFADFNRNKLGVTINLKSKGARALVLDLVEKCDVVVENFSSGVIDRLGLSYDDLTQRRPDLIMMGMPGLGSTGPNRDWVTWGPNIQHWVGMSELWTEPGYPEPVGSQASHPDYLSGLHGAVAIMAALHYRSRTGKGQKIELAQAECAAALMGPAYLEVMLAGRDPQRRGNGDSACAPHGLYPCAGQDRWIAVVARTDSEWVALCSLGPPELAADPRFHSLKDRLAHREVLDQAISAWTAGQDPIDLAERLQEVGVPASAMMTGADLNHDPHLNERGFITQVEHPTMRPLSFPGIPIKLSRTPGAVQRHAPLLGQDTERVCTELLGLSPAEVSRLRAEGALT